LIICSWHSFFRAKFSEVERYRGKWELGRFCAT
jgi:hypothetical protein